MGESAEGDAALYRLSYVSDILASSLDALDSTLQQILIRSHVLNTRDGVTGFLITYGGLYAQVIEGPRGAVEGCYARIRRDPRHTRLEVRSRGAVGVRLFPQWSMCGLTLSARDAGVLAFAEQTFHPDLRAASPPALLRFLIAMSLRYNDQVSHRHQTLRLI